jgi:hypothetical protein
MILFVLGVLLVSIPAVAAIDRPLVAARLGFNVANLRGDDINEISMIANDELDSRVGFLAGGYLEYPLRRRGLSIMAGLFYSAKGATETARICDQGMCLDLDMSWRFDYLEVPLALKMRFPTGPVEPYAFAGPAFAVKIGSDVEVDFRLGHDVVKLEDVKGFDTGLIFGGGVGIPFGRYEVTFEGQYSLGLMSIGPMTTEGAPPDTPSFGEDIKHRGLSFSAGFGFQI